jgi:hypothetical protein
MRRELKGVLLITLLNIFIMNVDRGVHRVGSVYIELSASIYDRFIENDDKNIIRIFRRLFIIYKFKLRDVAMNFFFQWRNNVIRKCELKVISNNECFTVRERFIESKTHFQIKSSRNEPKMTKRDDVEVHKVDQFAVLPKQSTLYEKIFKDKVIKELGQKSLIKEITSSTARKKKSERSKSSLIDPGYIKIEEVFNI